MSTNHRPTLESKKGKKRAIGDTIIHGRNLPQQTTLKYRTDIIAAEKVREKDPQELDGETSKRRLLESRDNSHEPKETKAAVNNEDNILDTTKNSRYISSKPHESEVEPTDPSDEQQSKDEKTKDEHEQNNNEHSNDDKFNESSEVRESDSGSESDSRSESDSEFDDESDTEALLEELNKIKQEKEKQRVDNQNSTLPKNPLIDPEPKQKSWRSSTFRRNKANNNNKDNDRDKFTTNTIDSEFHQSFLSKYIR